MGNNSFIKDHQRDWALRTPIGECEVGSMATKGRPYDVEAWRNAKKICRLSARQVEMARALGMNPKKLPSLRPSPQQRWKLPVGEFIEACYWKRFGGDPLDRQPHKPEPTPPTPSKPPTGQRDPGVLRPVQRGSFAVSVSLKSAPRPRPILQFQPFAARVTLPFFPSPNAPVQPYAQFHASPRA